MTRTTMQLADFINVIKGQGVPIEHVAFKCVVCGTIQSGRMLINAGACKTFDDVEKFLGFSCVGRWTYAGPHQRGTEPGRGCNWTLGGLFSIHELEVIDEEGKAHPRFVPATPEEAKALMESRPTEVDS